MSENKIISSEIRFDVIFIDGLHLSNQVDRDIFNSMKYIKNDGFIVLHDCNPPTEWNARDNHYFHFTPAGRHWNGTTWKAFLKWRCNPSIYSCCIDSDWGVGILSKNHKIGLSLQESNPFFEFNEFYKDKKHFLNLINFEKFKKLLE